MRVFVSYAHVDESLRARLRAHLSALERERLIQAWDDREIIGGEDWGNTIDERLNQADVVLLLVTADFIQSDYCFGKELTRALERNADPHDRAIVIPVILKKCDWETSVFARLQALPRNAHPLAEWKTEDHYFTEVAKGLRRRILNLRAPDSHWVGRVGQRLRDPLWWQRPAVWGMASLVLLMAIGGALAWWRAAAQTNAEVSLAMQALRSGRYSDAARTLEPACARFVSRSACFALDKARLGVLLEQPDTLPLEKFAAQVEALKAQAPDDPDLLLISAELTLREARADRHARALDDIDRAIALAGGDYPEAYFYLANLRMIAGKFAEALPLLDRALDSNKVAPDHYLNTRAYARMKTGDVPGAIADYERSAELGSTLSRIEVAALLWRRSQFDRAADQLLAASRAWAAVDPPTGRNALPWVFETEDGDPLVLKRAGEKRCLARWMLHEGFALAGRNDAEGVGTEDVDCGPQASGIRSAVAAMRARAITAR